MTTLALATTRLPQALESTLEQVCGEVAPVWPLDRFIAVNPFWPQVQENIEAVAAQQAAHRGARLTMPRAWYREQWQAGRFRLDHIQAALDAQKSAIPASRVVASLEAADPQLPVRARFTDVLDAGRDLHRNQAWSTFVVTGISRHCARWFQSNGPASDATTLYSEWRQAMTSDPTATLLLGQRGINTAARQLPEHPEMLFALALSELGVSLEQSAGYLRSLLLEVGGWASAASYRNFQASQSGEVDDTLKSLLAIRLGWELLLFRTSTPEQRDAWEAAKARWTACDAMAQSLHQVDWILQRAFELATHAPLVNALATPPVEAHAEPDLLAAFCIDVRSEVFRRCLESSDTEVGTLGFAGFFGLPAEFRDLASQDIRPALPGPLAPKVRVEVQAPLVVESRRSAWLDLSLRLKDMSKTPLSGFTFVESLGLGFAARLMADGAALTRPVQRPAAAGLRANDAAKARPVRLVDLDGQPLSVEARAELAANILTGLGLKNRSPRLVALVGHAASCANNPHAGGLDCGACCGQSGEVNARAVAELLNDPDVRQALARHHGIRVAATTQFIAGLHDTTTDRVTLYEADRLPRSHHTEHLKLRRALTEATRRTRLERASKLRLDPRDDSAVRRDLERRAVDWAETRPEWGLAGNSAFVIAPRSRTKGLDLGGRVFLHDYDASEDDGALLTLLLTAPMVVAHWINLQYYASTVDNVHFGAGNKVLHNVVGGSLGVFEGNGGDLRTGLSMQSLHDGQRWIHEPVRLGVFVQASRDAIAQVMLEHPVVRDLVSNGWVHLHQLDADRSGVHRWENGDWTRVDATEPVLRVR